MSNEPMTQPNFRRIPAPVEDHSEYRITELPYGTRRKIKVIILGAGASALDFLKKSEEQLQDTEIVCYEKNNDVGGTWLENRYPGCACDIPSVNYQFSWNVKLWSKYYSSSREIWRYLKDIEEENNFTPKYIRLRHKVEGAEWDPTHGLWRITIRRLDNDTIFEDTAEFFINAGGILNNWKWPQIDGLDRFRGKLMHSAAYEEDYDVGRKKVAVIGSGSSGAQIVAAVQGKVQKLYHWVRSPTWITSGYADNWAGKDGANFNYTEEQLHFLAENPQKYLEYRKLIETELNKRFRFIINGSEEAREARNFSVLRMREKLNYDSRLCDKMIPTNFNPGCRRPTPAPGYLEALVAANSTVFTEDLSRITEHGFVDQDGKEYEVDVIICATGFDTSWIPSFPFITVMPDGSKKDLAELWGSPEGVTSYLSIGVANFPNHFSFGGPYGPLAHGSFMPLIESWTQYIIQVISKAQVEGIKSLYPRAERCDMFRQHADFFLKRTVWASPCRSWFKQGKADGQITLWPGSRLHFLELMKRPRYEDFEIEYWNDNVFSFLGNGFEVQETNGGDLSYYLGSLGTSEDDSQSGNYSKSWLIERLAGWAIE